MKKLLTTVLFLSIFSICYAQKNKLKKEKSAESPATHLSLMLNGKKVTQTPKGTLSGLSFDISPKNNYRIVWEAILMRGDKKVANNFGDSMVGEKLLTLGFVQAMRKPGDKLVLQIKKIRLKKGDNITELKPEPVNFTLPL